MRKKFVWFFFGLQSIISAWAIYHAIFELQFNPANFIRTGNSVTSNSIRESCSHSTLIGVVKGKFEYFDLKDTLDLRFDEGWIEVAATYDSKYFPTFIRHSSYSTLINLLGKDVETHYETWVLCDTVQGDTVYWGESSTRDQLTFFGHSRPDVKMEREIMLCRFDPEHGWGSNRVKKRIGTLILRMEEFEYSNANSVFGYHF